MHGSWAAGHGMHGSWAAASWKRQHGSCGGSWAGAPTCTAASSRLKSLFPATAAGGAGTFTEFEGLISGALDHVVPSS